MNRSEKRGNTLQTVIIALSWLASIVILLWMLFNLLAGLIIPAIPLLVLTSLLLPPARTAFHTAIGQPLPGWVYAISMVVLSVAYVGLLLRSVMLTDSVFKSAEVEAAMMAIYDKKLAGWPVPYETRMVETRYGQVHVIISGAEDAPPVFLLNAAAMSAWSWRDNIAALSQQYRTYAIDTIGEANRSVLTDSTTYPADGEALAHLYAEIADALGVERAPVVGASYGGFIATNCAH